MLQIVRFSLQHIYKLNKKQKHMHLMNIIYLTFCRNSCNNLWGIFMEKVHNFASTKLI